MVQRDEIRTGERAAEEMPPPDAGVVFIGRIRTPWTDRLLCPLQGRLDRLVCRIEVSPPWAPDGLDGIGVIPWSPLARGRLTREWDETSARSETDEFGKKIYAQTADADRKVVERLVEVAAERGVPRAQVALTWVLARPGVTAPIVGATKLQHLDDAIAALALQLSPKDVTRLEEPYVPHAVAGFV